MWYTWLIQNSWTPNNCRNALVRPGFTTSIT
jgi:hypothetical protein